MNSTFKIGITIGDANGIGPEIALRTAADPRWPSNVSFVLVGPETAIVRQADGLGLSPPRRFQLGSGQPKSRVVMWDPDPRLAPTHAPGRVAADAAEAAAVAIEQATRACLEGWLDAMVTGPICKEGLSLAGIDEVGHTEMIARLTGSSRFGMMLMGGGLRVLLATRHVPLSRVSETLDYDKVLTAIELTHEGLAWLGIKHPRIGVCGLNPHAGDGGMLGAEERLFISPAIEAARAQGVDVDDVVPADVIFYKALKGDYDAVVAMYHDQGLAPLKMIAFEDGINLTLGLPIVRTSPDHGTAFDIAGKGVANPSSMIAATQLACKLAKAKNVWK